MNKPSKHALQQSKLILEELEERRLFSGGIEGLIDPGLDSDANAIYSDINGSQAQVDDTGTDAAAAERAVVAAIEIGPEPPQVPALIKQRVA